MPDTDIPTIQNRIRSKNSGEHAVGEFELEDVEARRVQPDQMKVSREVRRMNLMKFFREELS